MNRKPESTSRNLARSIAMGVLLSMLFCYSMHVLGSWEIENYRPDPETTSTVLLHNKCAVFGTIHTLRPNTDISTMGDGIDGTRLGASFMNFVDGHIIAMILIAVLTGVPIFFLRKKIQENNGAAAR